MAAEVVVPAGEGRAVHVRKDEVFRLIDVDGGQVADLFAFVDAPAGDGADAAALSEWMSAEHTRPGIKRLFPRPGDVALTNRRRPILRLEDDASPGWHDTLYAACDPARYALLGHGGPHRSCATNLVEALRDVGRELPGMPEPIVPQPFNVFMHVEVGPEGVLQLHPATSRGGLPDVPGVDQLHRRRLELPDGPRRHQHRRHHPVAAAGDRRVTSRGLAPAERRDRAAGPGGGTGPPGRAAGSSGHATIG